MAYLHGAYGEITASKIKSTVQADTVVAYVGTAPINLIRGYADLDLVNVPIKLNNLVNAQSKIGYASDWNAFTLCEAVAQHFDNTVGNVGPIYVINVLDPTTHRKDANTSVSVAFTNGRGEFASSTIILDTIAIAEKTEGTDFAVDYDFAAGKVIITSLVSGSPLTGNVTVTFREVNTAAVQQAAIIGSVSAGGVYSGIQAIRLLYQRENAVLNILAAPGWSHIPAVYTAMVSAVQKINGHWDGFVLADIPLVSTNPIDTKEKAEAWADANGYTSELSKVFWPMIIDGAGRHFHLSTVCAATMQRVDAENYHIPFETPSNKQIMCTGQYFGEGATNMGFDQEEGNELNAHGITTAVYWGSRWVLWGPHTAAYRFNGDMDARSIFDSTIRMLEHCTNGFQQRHGVRVDSPMDTNKRDTIINIEQEVLDRYVGLGALIGSPTIEFQEIENPEENIVNGDFLWHIMTTPTPPMKSATARVTYTSDGFAAYFEGSE